MKGLRPIIDEDEEKPCYFDLLGTHGYPTGSPYLIGYRGKKHRYFTYSSIKKTLLKDFPYLLGKPIVDQLIALELYEVFLAGETPFPIPYTFI